ncbi:MAG TPA: hypothetical protein VNZ52_07400 [Candidatus Thermoplasmatota archaeon]|nr:hypothetical protein [Candidatus Thermoplasmatota archaeon]
MDLLGILRAVGGTVLLLWLPGYLWVKAVFQEQTRNPVERFVLAVLISVASLTLWLFGGNRFLGIPINAWTAITYCLVTASIPAGMLLWRRYRAPKPKAEA